jgi:hypothetical protein
MDESSSGAPAAAIVVRQSRLQRDGLFGALVLDGRGAARVLSRDRGDQLRVVRLGSGRYRQAGLAVAGTGAGPAIPLPFFSMREVRQQCLAAGWSFAGRR